MVICHLGRENCLVQDARLSHRDKSWDSLLGHQTYGTPELLTQPSVCSAHFYGSVGSTDTPRDGPQVAKVSGYCSLLKNVISQEESLRSQFSKSR